jgi:hypothetical protein
MPVSGILHNEIEILQVLFFTLFTVFSEWYSTTNNAIPVKKEKISVLQNAILLEVLSLLALLVLSLLALLVLKYVLQNEFHKTRSRSFWTTRSKRILTQKMQSLLALMVLKY